MSAHPLNGGIVFRRILTHAARALLFCALGFTAANVGAVPVQMTAVTTLNDSQTDIPGTTMGDTLTISVIVDNGGTSLLSQSWTVLNIVSGRVDVGTYAAFYTSSFFAGSGFTTDAAGLLTTAVFADLVGDVSDTFGTSAVGALFNDAVRDTQERLTRFGDDVDQPNRNLSLWSAAFVSVPEPGTLVLLGAGLIGLCMARRSRNA